MSANTLLVVDDDAAIHKLVQNVLYNQNWVLKHAFNADEALQVIGQQHFDVVLTDLRMPGMDGLDLVRRIREIRPETKVLVMTGRGTPADVVCAIRAQAFSYFSKPFSPSALSDMLLQALHTRVWEDDIRLLSASPQWITLKLRCKMETADRLLQFLRELEMDLPVRDREDIAGAFRELLMNAIEHGGKADPDKWVRVSFVRTSRAVVYYIQDPGHGFSFDALPHAAVGNPPGDPVRHTEVRSEQGVRPGGFGILLTRHLVDELIYNEKGNEVLFIKYLNGQ